MKFDIILCIGVNAMTALSIILPDKLAKASQEAASELGLSRTEFIRQAVIHELQSFRERREREALIESLKALSHSKNYLKEVEDIEGLDTLLPKERDQWWKK